MEFPGFLGNEEVKAALGAAFASSRFPHAIVLQGEAGVGKRTLAGIIANALVCRKKELAPCGECPSCRRFKAGSHPDVRIISGSGVTRSLSVDTVKALISDACRMPEEADYSVYILLMGSKTGEAAQNKLLKLIEEPPDGAVFIFVVESAEQLLLTIRSRAQCFTLRPPKISDAAERFTELTGASIDEAESLSVLCKGNIGKMLAEKDGGEEARAGAAAKAIAGGMLASSSGEIFLAAAGIQKDRPLCDETISKLQIIFRDACVLRAGGKSLISGAPEIADRLSDLPADRLYSLVELCDSFRQRLGFNVNLPLALSWLCLKLREAAGH